MVAGWTLVSRLTGFGRVAVTAAVLGPTYFGNTYQVTNTLPNTVYYGLLAGALVSSILVPALVQHIDRGDRESSERVAGGSLGIVLVGLIAVIPVVLLAAPVLLQWAAAGAGQGAAAGQERVTRLFLLMLLPQVFLYAVVGCSSAVMNAHRRFALAAAAPALENVGCIAVLLLTAQLYGGRTELATVPTGELLLLGLGTTGAVALHAATQWYGARRAGVALRPRAGWRDPEVTGVLRRAVPALAQTALHAVQTLAVLVVANRVAGGIVAYQVAANFFFLPIAMGATPVAVSLLPRLSRLHQAGDERLFRDTLVRGLRFALFVAMPAAVVLAVLAPVLATAVSFGRMSAEGGEAMVAATLLVLAPGVLGETAFLVGTYASYARGDTRSPLRSMLVKFSTCVALLAVALTARGPAVAPMAGLAVAVGAGAGAVHRISALLRGLPPGGERLLPAVLRTALAAGLMAGPLWVGARLLAPVTGQLGALAGAALVCLLGGTAYLGVQALLRAPETGWVLGALSQRRAAYDSRGAP
ncbi:MAG TPA: lipid II flippase MurJ [Mycobacteriales bacterium]